MLPSKHPWTSMLHMAIEFGGHGIGGKSAIFQAGPDPWAIKFAMVANYPSGQQLGQDLFNSGAISSAADFQVYEDSAGLSGLDFAYADHIAVYHTEGFGASANSFDLQELHVEKQAKSDMLVLGR